MNFNVENQKFHSFAEFFARKKELQIEKTDDNVLISPCDSLLSVYQISENSSFCVKDSLYRFEDLVSEPEISLVKQINKS
ncbi:MAG: phosphatidylserine decarboxylase [Pseudobutyrivibrio sp.]|nr:phosphatidylserine decarboxylase [Pseudobutyrivibrio sp.]